MRHLVRCLAVLAALGAISDPVYAQCTGTCRYAIANGNWSAPGTWNAASCAGGGGASVPGNGVHVVICTGRTVTLNTNTSSLASLSVQGALVLGNNNTSRTLTVAGDIANDGSITLANNNTTHVLNVSGDIINNGTFDLRRDNNSLGTANFTGVSTQTISGTGAMEFNNSTVASHLTINKAAGAVTQTGTLTFNAAAGNLTVQAGTLEIANSITVTGATTVGGVLTHTTTTGTRSFAGGVTIDSGGNWTNPANEAITIGTRLVNNGSFTSGTALYTFDGDAANNGEWGGSQPIAFAGDITVTANASYANNNAALSVGDDMTLGAGTAVTNNGGVTIASDLVGAASSVWTNAANSTLAVGLTLLNNGTLNASATGNRVHYNGGGAQTLKRAANGEYFHLEVSGGGNKTPAGGGAHIVNGDLVINAGPVFNATGNDQVITVLGTATVAGTYTGSNSAVANFQGDLTIAGGGTFTGTGGAVNVSKNFTNNGTFTSGNSVYTFDGSASQTIAGVNNPAFVNLAVDSAGVVLSGVSPTVSGTLTLQSGAVATGGNLLMVTNNAAGAIARTAGFVEGNLGRAYPGSGTNVTRTFTVGTGGDYAPVDLSFASISGAGSVVVSTTAGDHPQLGSSSLDPAASVNRYWTIGNVTVTFTTATATLNFVDPDKDSPGLDPLTFGVAAYDSTLGAWAPVEHASATANSIQAVGLDAASFAGEFAVGAVRALYSWWRFDEGSWNGTANQVADHGTGNHAGTAAGLSSTQPNTAGISPAVAGTPGTCRYGVFDRTNKHYVALPAGYPALMASGSAGFTVTAWVNTTNSALTGQRIMIDDQGNASPGGWGFSIGETDGANGGTGNGGLRFYYRQPTVFIVDTTPIPSNQWLFVALSVRLAAGANNSRARLYVFNAAGALINQSAAAFESFTWTPGSDAGPPSLGGETNASGENTNQFGFSGAIDEVRVYQAPLSRGQIEAVQAERHPCAVVDHYEASHSGSAVTCQATNVTVSAHDPSHALVPAGSTITLTARRVAGAPGNRGDWTLVTGAGALANGAADDGQATYTFAAGETSATFALKNTHVQTVNIDVVDNNGLGEGSGAGAAHADANLDFSETGFLFSAIGTQVAGTTSVTRTLQAVRTDTQTGACTGIFGGLVSNVELAFECVNPGTCQAGQQVTFTNNGSGAIAANPAGAVTSWTSRTLNFGANSTANFTVSYPDVGVLRLHARYNIPLGAGGASGNLMTGASPTEAPNGGFVVRPAGFTISNVARTGGGGGPYPGAADANGPVFAKAGEPFSLTVTARNSLGNPTPNYGKESPAEGVKLTADLVGGLGLSVNPGLGNGTIAGAAFSAGAAQVTNVTWREVGIITITPSIGDASYLGTGDVTGTASSNIGRFTPYKFTVSYNTPRFTTACAAGTFTYAGQPFTYDVPPELTVTAVDDAGTPTTLQNYKGSFFKITGASLTGKAYSAAVGTLDTGGLPANDPQITDNNDGTAKLSFASGAGLAFTRTTPVAPFAAEISLAINVVDSDGVAFDGNPARFGTASPGNGIAFTAGKAMRFGRLRLQNSAGAAQVVLPVPIEAQYWNGAGFVTNAQDSCTSLARGNITLSDYDGGLAACETRVEQATIAFAAGAATLSLAAPGTTNSGSVRVTVNAGDAASGNFCATVGGAEQPAGAAMKSWLRGAWSGSSSVYDDDPSARASFGIFGSQPRNFIFFRENY